LPPIFYKYSSSPPFVPPCIHAEMSLAISVLHFICPQQKCISTQTLDTLHWDCSFIT
jgi:hypothetical protein